MASTLDMIRQKLNEQENKNENKTQNFDNTSYPFWKMKEDETAVLRFLPDGDPDNTFFWRERQVLKLPFNGVKGEHDNTVTVQVPCMEMYGKTCPVLSEVRQWYKLQDKETEKMANRYWKKRSYIFQGFVVDNPLEDDNPPENPIRRFLISPQIFKIIKESLMDTEMEEIPVDYDKGRDFKIKKKKSGAQYADYTNSYWSMQTRPLSDEEREAIDTYGLFDLKEYLPKMPNDDEVEVIKEMFYKSVEGEPYDFDKFGQYFRPRGSGNASGSETENNNTGDSEKTTVTKPNMESEDKEEQKSSNSDNKEDNNASSALSHLKKQASSMKNNDDKEESSEKSNETSSKGKGKQTQDPQDIINKLQQRRQKES